MTGGILAEARREIEGYLAGLRLKIHPVKSQLFETRRGAGFLGFRILPHNIRVKPENLRRARRRLRRLQASYRYGEIDSATVRQSIRSWIAHLEHGDTWRLRERVFAGLVFTRA